MKNLFAKVCFILIGTIILCGCQQNKGDRVVKNEQEEKKPILIFSIGSSSILSDFQTQYPDMDVEIVSIDTADVEKDFEDKIYKEGIPDIIIDTGNERGPGFWQEKGLCSDISTYVDTDTTFDEELYYPGTKTVGQIDNQVVALPLGLSIDYMTVREDMWINSGLHYLEENYTAEDLLTVLEQELDYQNELFTSPEEEGMYQVLADWSGDFVFLLWDYGAVSISGNEVQLDENLFNLICRIYEKHCWNFTYANQQGTPAMNTKSSPLENGAMYIITTWFNSSINKGAAPQIGISYAESINTEVFGQGTKVLWQPMKRQDGEEAEYAARVSTWGMVGSQTERKEEAYQILRNMMDLELAAYDQADGKHEIPFSVNREQALAMITKAEENPVSSYRITDETGNSTTIMKQSMSLQNRTELERVLNNITSIYTIDQELQNQIFDIVYPYVQGEAGNYEGCYKLVLDLLQQEISAGSLR